MNQEKSTKGQFQGICNMSSCKSNLPATWYNHGSYAYYCQRCAKRLNSDPYNIKDAMRMFGHSLCTEGKQQTN